MDANEIIALLKWGLGLSFTGFLALSGWIHIGLRGAHSRIDELSKDIKLMCGLEESIKQIKASISKMESALIGSYEKPDGLVQRHDDLEKRVNRLESR